MSVTVTRLDSQKLGTHRVETLKFARGTGAQSAALKIGERIDYARVFVKGGTVFDTRVETVSGLTMTEAADGVTSITVATPLIANDSENCVVELYIAPSQPGSHPTIATGL